jgi:hypothetical protein
MNARIANILLAVPLALDAGPCANRPYRGPLRGTWSISMTVESTLPGYTVPAGTTVHGVVTVPDPTPVIPRAFPGEMPADVRVDLEGLGVAALPARQPVAQDLAGDSVRLDLGRTRNRLVLLGRLVGSSITGTWRDEFRAGGCHGRFVMRRKA